MAAAKSTGFVLGDRDAYYVGRQTFCVFQQLKITAKKILIDVFREKVFVKVFVAAMPPVS